MVVSRCSRRRDNDGVSLEDRDPASLTIFDFFAYLVADDDAAAARERFCEVVATEIGNVASWLGVDAWLGAGDVQDTSSTDLEEQDPTRRRSFFAVGLVAQISSELVSGALLLFRNGNEYSASALIRQLIECEYLLRAFGLNFADAARWHDANDSERWDFKPSKLRNIGGFDRKEYADHCGRSPASDGTATTGVAARDRQTAADRVRRHARPRHDPGAVDRLRIPLRSDMAGPDRPTFGRTRSVRPSPWRGSRISGRMARRVARVRHSRPTRRIGTRSLLRRPDYAAARSAGLRRLAVAAACCHSAVLSTAASRVSQNA